MAKRSYALLIALALLTCAAGIYKWVDEKGIAHYSDRPAAGRPSEEIKSVAPGREPAAKAVAPDVAAEAKSVDQLEREFQARRLKEEEREFEERRAERERARASLTAPDAERRLASSEYLVTTKTWIKYEMHLDRLAGVLGLAVRAKSENKESVWLRVFFELPATPSGYREIDNPDPPLMTVALPKMIRVVPNEEVEIDAPPAEHFRCRSYIVTILMYSDSAGRELLGEHPELIYSRLNGMKIRSDTALGEALRAQGKCVPPVEPD